MTLLLIPDRFRYGRMYVFWTVSNALYDTEGENKIAKTSGSADS